MKRMFRLILICYALFVAGGTFIPGSQAEQADTFQFELYGEKSQNEECFLGYLMNDVQEQSEAKPSDIRYLAMAEYYNDESRSVLIDFAHAKIYEMRPGLLFKDIRFSDHVLDMIDADINEIKSVLLKPNIQKWEQHYVGTNYDTTADYGWRLSIEHNDGSIAQFSISGAFDTNSPDDLSQFIHDIWSFVDSKIKK